MDHVFGGSNNIFQTDPKALTYLAHYLVDNKFHSEFNNDLSFAYILRLSAKSLLIIMSVTCMLMTHRFTYHFHNQMHKNLKLNPDKTYLIIIGNKQQRNRVISHFPVNLLGSDTFPLDTVRNLSVVFDKEFNFGQHIFQVCKSCFYHIRDLRRIRPHIFISTAKTISTAIISSSLGYCNSLLNILLKET